MFYYLAITRREAEVGVQWLGLTLVIEAAASLILSTLNCLYFGHYALVADRPARRVGATALIVVNLAFASEAGAYLVVTPSEQRIEFAVALGLRSLLLLAVSFLSLLIWRQGYHSQR